MTVYVIMFYPGRGMCGILHAVRSDRDQARAEVDTLNKNPGNGEYRITGATLTLP